MSERKPARWRGHPLTSVIGVAIVGLGCRAPSSSSAGKIDPIQSTGPVNVLVIANSDVRDIPLGLAIDDLNSKGYAFRVTPMTAAPFMVETLAREGAEIVSLNNETIWTATTRGVRTKLLLQRLNFPNLLIGARGVANCRLLSGQPVAVGASTGLNPRLLELYLDRECAGVKPDYLVMPDGSARTAALTKGAVQAALVPLEEFLRLQQQEPGAYAMLVDLTREFPLLAITGVHARSDWLDAHPQAARDFIRALLVAHRRIRANPAAMYNKVADTMHVDAAWAKLLVDAYIDARAWDPNGALTRANVQYTIDFLKGLQAIPSTLQYDEVADLSYLDDVLKEIGRQ